MLRPLTVTSVLAAGLLGACAGVPLADTDMASDAALVPMAWHAPLPHGGQSAELARWWGQFDDPLLAELVGHAQAHSPTLATARARIEAARAARVAAGAALQPSLDATGSVVRGRQDVFLPLGTSLSAALQAGWELDVFGRNRAARDAAQERFIGAEAGWHEARVAVAAEVGLAYTGLRACEAQLEQSSRDARSRAETSRLTDLSARAGFQAPAAASLAQASAAQARAAETQQRARCAIDLHALIALTGVPAGSLRTALAASTARLPNAASLAVTAVPAEVLAQRPDVYRAAREVLAAAGDVRRTDAERYPRIALAGMIGATRVDTGAGTLSGGIWTLGPVSVSLPVFDAGVRRANLAAARARYDEALIGYAGRLRAAVREVEDALVTLDASAAREADARLAATGFQASLQASEARYRGGLGNLFELEDSRRSAVLAQSALIDLQRERVAAWIALYRALGGGWHRPNGPAAPSEVRPAPLSARPTVDPA